MKHLICLLVLIVVLASDAQVFKLGRCPKIPAQQTFNVKEYLGTWHEIERFPAVFEAGRCVRAEYSLRDDSKIKVNNSYIDDDGKLNVAIGEAYVPDPSNPAELKVSFGPSVFAGEYRVVDTDYKQYSLVTSCAFDLVFFHFEFAWILSRTPTLSGDVIQALKQKIGGPDGFAVSSFMPTDQTNCPA